MSLKTVWKRKNGLTLVQLVTLESIRAQERLSAEQERVLFQQWEELPKLLAEHDAKRKAYVEKIEARITNGWQPNIGEWAAIELSLAVLHKERKKLIDPTGIGELVDVLKKREPSPFDRYAFYRPWRFR